MRLKDTKFTVFWKEEIESETLLCVLTTMGVYVYVHAITIINYIIWKKNYLQSINII